MPKSKASLTIKIPPAEAKRLRAAAFAFATTPDEMLRHIAAKVTQDILSMPEESLDEYENPEEILGDLKQALRDQKEGKVLRKLPRHLRSL